MKKVLALIILAVLILNAPAFAVEPLQPAKAGSKLARGLTNVATCWGEYFNQLTTATEKSPDYLSAFFLDIFRGTAYTIKRAAVGVYDVVTFPFPGTTNYGPVMQPETVVGVAAEAVAN